uniref:Uncharacterized protein n=1 Tax=Cannabis sativa TaxID=3483 RepID=A0A803NMH2_CANSA
MAQRDADNEYAAEAFDATNVIDAVATTNAAKTFDATEVINAANTTTFDAPYAIDAEDTTYAAATFHATDIVDATANIIDAPDAFHGANGAYALDVTFAANAFNAAHTAYA